VAGALTLLVSLALAATAAAQGMISDPPATFTRPFSAFDATPVASLTGVSADPTTDHLFQMGWWYRIAGDTAEKFFPAPSAESYVSDSSTVTWNDVDNRGFRAVETNVVTNGGGPSGQVVFSLTLTNLSDTAPLGIDVFNMADMDLGGTTEGDTAVLLSANDRMRLTEGADTAEYGAEGADAFLVLTYQGSSGLPDVRARLSDAVVDNFDNSGLPFGPGDFTGGFQWATTVIPPSGSATFVAGIAVNMALAFPGGSTTTSTLTTVSTTSTTLESELCDNCVDDDGDGLVDFEDDDCCAATAMTLGKSVLRSRGQGVAVLKLTARLAASPVADGGVATQDLTLQLRAGDGVFCARVPAASLVRRRKGLTFHDRHGSLASARGVTRIALLERRRTVRLVVSGSQAELDAPAPGPLTAILGLRDPATGNRCVSGTATFRPAKRGVRYP